VTQFFKHLHNHTPFFLYLRSGDFHRNVSCQIYNIVMSYDTYSHTHLVDPISENELNEYIMITKMNFNTNDLVSD
jgi:hypothetical protein